MADSEKEQRHWLTSPLFARGLPQQIPAQHGLMHPFFGIQPVRNEVRVTKAAAADSFLEGLSQLQRGPGAELNAYLARTIARHLVRSCSLGSTPPPGAYHRQPVT